MVNNEEFREEEFEEEEELTPSKCLELCRKNLEDLLKQSGLTCEVFCEVLFEFERLSKEKYIAYYTFPIFEIAFETYLYANNKELPTAVFYCPEAGSYVTAVIGNDDEHSEIVNYIHEKERKLEKELGVELYHEMYVDNLEEPVRLFTDIPKCVKLMENNHWKKFVVQLTGV